MKLYEFQGKRLFKTHGVPVPMSALLTSPSQSAGICPPAVLKAQVLTGGRGKAGGIKMWDRPEDLPGLVQGLFAMAIKGEATSAILAEERVRVLGEIYISITYNGSKATPVLMASSAGGMDIERVAHDTPEKIVAVTFDPFTGPADYQARYVAKSVGCGDARGFKKLLDALYAVYKNCDATLVEINPLAITPAGLVALDSKVVLDDRAAFRHKDLFSELAKEQRSLLGIDEEAQKEETITYVPLTGTVGLISDGAGTGMLTLDLIRDAGGEAADFCEMGGFTSPEVIYNAMSTVLKNPRVKSLLIVLIGGFNRMDEMALGILRYRKDFGLGLPVVIRMCGTLEDVGKEMMAEAGMPTHDNLLEAVRTAVSLAGGR